MVCNFDDFRDKEIINIKTGGKVGYPDDFEFETKTAKICRVIVYGKLKFFGLFGREENIVIPWSEIEVVGDDTILINSDLKH
jgi:YlmC/YmxH family sporulation protein